MGVDDVIAVAKIKWEMEGDDEIERTIRRSNDLLNKGFALLDEKDRQITQNTRKNLKLLEKLGKDVDAQLKKQAADDMVRSRKAHADKILLAKKYKEEVLKGIKEISKAREKDLMQQRLETSKRLLLMRSLKQNIAGDMEAARQGKGGGGAGGFGAGFVGGLTRGSGIRGSLLQGGAMGVGMAAGMKAAQWAADAARYFTDAVAGTKEMQKEMDKYNSQWKILQGHIGGAINRMTALPELTSVAGDVLMAINDKIAPNPLRMGKIGAYKRSEERGQAAQRYLDEEGVDVRGANDRKRRADEELTQARNRLRQIGDVARKQGSPGLLDTKEARDARGRIARAEANLKYANANQIKKQKAFQQWRSERSVGAMSSIASRLGGGAMDALRNLGEADLGFGQDIAGKAMAAIRDQLEANNLATVGRNARAKLPGAQDRLASLVQQQREHQERGRIYSAGGYWGAIETSAKKKDPQLDDLIDQAKKQVKLLEKVVAKTGVNKTTAFEDAAAAGLTP